MLMVIKVYKISIESSKALRLQMKHTKNVNAYKRMQSVAMRCEGKTNAEISEVTGINPDWVGQLCKKYCNEGIAGLLNDGRKGGNNRNMSKEEAEIFMDQFREQAEKGQVITAVDISTAYDKAIGKNHKSLSSAYYFLHSQG
jgi:transposase